MMPNATITVDAALKERLTDLASHSVRSVDEFVEALLRRIEDVFTPGPLRVRLEFWHLVTEP